MKGGGSGGDGGDGGKCNYYNRTGNSDPFSIRANYGGIPESLVVNLLGWLALLVLFLVMRKNVFNVMSRGLQRNLGRVTEVLFSGDTLADPEPVESREDPEAGEDVGDETAGAPATGQSELARRTSRESRGFLSWLTNTLKCLLYSEEKMLELAGPDAVQYLRFQIYLIAFLALLTLLSISVILPINFQGENYGNKSDFGHTTIINLDTG